FPRVVAEVVVTGAGSENQIVIINGVVAQEHAAAGQVDVSDLSEKHLCILLPLQNGSQRCGNVRRRQRSGRDLVKQRLKEVEVAAVHQRHTHGRVLQPPGGMQAAKAAADDYDMGKLVHLGHVLDPKPAWKPGLHLRMGSGKPSSGLPARVDALPKKKVSGTFGRSKLQHFLRLRVPDTFFWVKPSFSGTIRPGSASRECEAKREQACGNHVRHAT